MALDALTGKFPTVTVHGRPAGTYVAPWDPYDRFAARWSLGPDESEKTLEAEELLDPPPVAGELVLLRYLHAIRDTSSHTFRHVDGAVRAYTRDAYEQRREMQFATPADDLVRFYRKVFLADGKISAARCPLVSRQSARHGVPGETDERRWRVAMAVAALLFVALPATASPQA